MKQRPSKTSQNVPCGSCSLKLEDLPSPDTKRWVIQRKAKIVTAVRQGLLTLDEACRRYSLSIDEFMSWQRLMDQHGFSGLRTTKLQTYRTIVTLSEV